ncbi:MAG TPA: HlyD family efflux transporter periplasmic adaptor subunit [Flavisolibacter sp.]
MALERAHAGEDKGFVAVVQLRQENFDQVGKGQKARIKLRAYNSADFGVLEGTVVAVAEEFSSHDGSFEVRISVPVKRKTTRGYEVRYVPGMLGDVEIIVRKERLIQKLIRF